MPSIITFRSWGRHLCLIPVLLLLASCVPQTETMSPVAELPASLVTFPGSATKSDSPTNSPTSTSTAAPAETATRTPEPTYTLTRIPRSPHTPTRGLPPTITLSPKETCPPPTHAKVDIVFTQDIAGYGPQIVDYFRANGDRADLGERLEKAGGNVPNTVEFTEADLTGDQVKETVVILKQVNLMIGTGKDLGVFIVGCRAGQYQLLSGANDFYLMGADPEKSGVLDILDLNADGIQEIILWDIFDWHSAHADWSFLFDVLEWNGNAFHTLFAEVEGSQGRKWMEVMNDRLELQDVDNNGTMDVLIPDWSGFTCGFGPVKIEKRIYMWGGRYYRYMWTDPGVPYFQFQAAFAGDYYSAVGLYDKAEKSYGRAIEDPSLKPYVFDGSMCSNRKPWYPQDPDYVVAYARLRLVELLAFLGNDADAEKQLNQLESKFPKQKPGHQYTILAEEFWRMYSPEKDIESACAAVREEAARRPEEIFDPLYFGYQDPGPTLETICPFHSEAGGE